MNGRDIIEDYHNWLISLIDTPDKEFSRNYSVLMTILDMIEYKWKNPKDENRALDGIELRNRFSDELGDKYSFRRFMPCTILECFVALFTRYSDTILVEDGDPSVAPELFFDALEGLGLLEFDDSHIDEEKILDILHLFVTGKIGIFGEKSGRFKTDLFMQVGKFCMNKCDFLN